MTVSAVLNGSRSNTRVAADTRRRIEAIAAELNYSANAMARGLRRQKTDTIGVLFTWAGTRTIHSLYSAAILDGIVSGAAAAGFHVLLYTKGWVSADVSSAAFADGRTDGVIVVSPVENSDVVSGLTALNLPVAVISSSVRDAGVPGVNIDNRMAVELVIEHLVSLGHTKIAYAGQTRERRSMRERHDFFREAMAARALAVPERFVLADLHAGSPERSEIARLLTEPEPPTALFASNDDLAAEVIETARAVGVDVPGKLSVVGVDDILVASLTTPKLTTIRLPLHEMGEMAARLLVARIQSHDASELLPIQTVVPELIVRDSTVPPSTS